MVEGEGGAVEGASEGGAAVGVLDEHNLVHGAHNYPVFLFARHRAEHTRAPAAASVRPSDCDTSRVPVCATAWLCGEAPRAARGEALRAHQ